MVGQKPSLGDEGSGSAPSTREDRDASWSLRPRAEDKPSNSLGLSLRDRPAPSPSDALGLTLRERPSEPKPPLGLSLRERPQGDDRGRTQGPGRKDTGTVPLVPTAPSAPGGGYAGSPPPPWQIGIGPTFGVGPGATVGSNDGSRDVTFSLPLSKPSALPGPSVGAQISHGRRSDGTPSVKYTVQAGWDVAPYGLVHVGTYLTVDPERPFTSNAGVQGKLFMFNGQLEIANAESFRTYLYKSYSDSLRALGAPAW
ncbi:MAG: hypothetical protein E6Q50_04960 [Lysobacter sp.]|nr:MAG: hypothetical protein E6Q50_04960 [Lysobacter sp.]